MLFNSPQNTHPRKKALIYFTSYQEIIAYIKNNDYKVINICGSPASGKSTLAKIISRYLNFELIDLDDHLYDSGCKRKSKNNDIKTLKKILNNTHIIIDGTYTSSLETRLDKVDLFILTSENRWKCLFRFFIRTKRKKNLKCGERFTKKTIELILNYKKIEKEKILSIIPNKKTIRFLRHG